VAALRKVKRIFDPNGVMNRGHLCFQGDENGAH
jgi:FAD/FMN-containing dehydrogenase